MNTDIRLSLTFKGHRKRRKLRTLLGDNATDFLIDLWLSAAQDRPTGTLEGWGAEDIALAAGWEGDSKVFVQAMEACRLIEISEGTYHLHNWEEHQPWACRSRERSEAASRSANMRWEQERNNAERMRNACEGQCGTHAQSAPSPSPSPSPIPSPEEQNIYSPIAEPIEPNTPKQKAQISIFDHWNGHDLIQHRKLTDAIKRGINGALANYSEDEIVGAIDNYAKILASPTHYFKYKWTLKDFLTRGLDKFNDWRVCDANYQSTGGGGNGRNAGNQGNHGPHDRVPDHYSSVEEILRG